MVSVRSKMAGVCGEVVSLAAGMVSQNRGLVGSGRKLGSVRRGGVDLCPKRATFSSQAGSANAKGSRFTTGAHVVRDQPEL
jgi:hypothetical protein